MPDLFPSGLRPRVTGDKMRSPAETHVDSLALDLERASIVKITLGKLEPNAQCERRFARRNDQPVQAAREQVAVPR